MALRLGGWLHDTDPEQRAVHKGFATRQQLHTISMTSQETTADADTTEPRGSKRKPEEDTTGAAESVYLFYLIVVGDDGTEMFRVPAGDLTEEQINAMKKFNNAYDGQAETEDDLERVQFVEDTVDWLRHAACKYERSRKVVGTGIMKPRDLVLDVFTLWLQA